MKTEKEMAIAAAKFADRWRGRGYERGESQPFWIDLLTNVFGVETLTDGFIRFEEHQMVDASNFIDCRIPSTRVLIEQKSLGKDLRAPSKQSDGSLLNPFQQARRYVVSLPVSEHPRWIVTCNFSEFLVYDMEQPNGEPEQILLDNLGKEYYRLLFLVDAKHEHLSKEMQVSMQAGEIVGRIYEALLKQYDDNSPEALRWLNILCVRIVFCLYAEDAGVFTHDQFHDFLATYEAKDIRRALNDLFEVLNTPIDKRSKYLQEELKAFPYTNGGLFEEKIEIPQFTEELKQTLLQHASLDFDWSEISPTIFGAVFESTLNPETRRSGGMHYTSIQNIHKVIDPLFLNDLRRELDGILEEKVERQRQKKLDAYQDRLASLTFLDPACGSGNFLTETYLSLRRLENEVIRERHHGQSFIGFEEVNPIKVSIQQFYGIEINDFAVTVATTALWISEAQMLRETEKIIRRDIDFLPLKSYTNIREGNALRMDWDVIEQPINTPTIYADKTYVTLINQESESFKASEPVFSYDEINLITNEFKSGQKQETRTTHVFYDYIIGNPPFVGYSLQSREQKEDILNVFVDSKGKPYKTAGKIDYVAGWYYKAAQLVHNTKARAALVSTNSITQGEQVSAIWKPLKELFDIHIDFAYRTFRWDSEASMKAHVHCVIVGFSNSNTKKVLYDGDNHVKARNINAYLIDAPDIFVNNRKHPICEVPAMITGNRPADGGHLIIEAEDYSTFVQQEPKAKPYIKKLLGAAEFINNKKRWCLWLVGVSPSILRQMPLVMKRIQACKKDRENAPDEGRRRLAMTPHLFREQLNPDTYILIPAVSSERRRYIPMGFLTGETIPTNLVQIIPNATLYHFGILESIVHMAWMRAVCGRLKSDYRYSKDVVYNNFPWATPTEKQKEKIEQTAQAILDARAKYPDSSLADLYDELTMPAELRKAHRQNDKAVLQAYGFDVKLLENENEPLIVAELFKMYQEMTKEV